MRYDVVQSALLQSHLLVAYQVLVWYSYHTTKGEIDIKLTHMQESQIAKPKVESVATGR